MTNTWLQRFCLFVLALMLAGHAYAQGIITGSINGTVQDPSGAVLANATVVATNIASGIATNVTSNSKGEFAISPLPVGVYKIEITTSGFEPLTLNNVQVTAGSSTGVGVEHLKLGSAVESVNVTTSQNILETTQAQLTTTFDTQEITDLPTGGRLDALALLIPGVVRTLGNNYANTNGTGLSSNGLRGRSNNFEIDGQTNNDNSVTGPQFFFRNEDALSEQQVLTNNFGAQYGRNAGSIVNYITKSGTNAYHGTAFETYFGSWSSSLLPSQKSSLFDFCLPGQVSGSAAYNGAVCNTPVVPRVTANEFGGVIGGPVIIPHFFDGKDKLFFFGSVLERLVTNGASPSSSTTLTPTPTGIQQLQAAFPNNGFVASLANQGPYSVKTGNPTPGTPIQIPVCAQASTSPCPAGSPTAQFATITRFLPSTSSDQEIVSRLDYQFTPKDRFFIRYMYQKAPTNVSGGTVSSGAYYNTTDIVHSVGADVTHTFSSKWVDQLRYGFQQSTLTFGGGGYPTCNDTNIASCPSNIAIGSTTYTGSTGNATLSSVGYGPATNIPQGRVVKATQVQNNANWSAGRHQITFGGEFDYQNSPNTFLPYTSGAFSFTNFNYALAGNATLNLANGAPNIPFKEPDVAAYFQDDWRITPTLTLNLGMRWEFFKQGINVLNQISTARQTGANPIWLTSLPLSLTTFPYIPNHYKNFEPRVGFAWNPSYDHGLVVRGGFAINFDPAFYNIFLNSYTAAPVVNTGVIVCDGVVVNCVPTAGTTNTLVHAQDDQYNPTGVNPGTKVQTLVSPNFSNPYTENYTLGVQHTIGHFAVGEVRYVGNHSPKQFQSLNANPNVAAAPPTAAVPAAYNYMTLAQAFPTQFPASSYCTTTGAVGLGRVDCNRTYVTTRANTAFSVYNALQLSLQIREYHGLSGSAAYTWSRAIDNTSEVYSGGSSGGNTIAVAQNPFNTNVAERGVSGDSYPNVTSLGLTYKLPFYKEQHGLVGRALGGFSTNLIYTFNSGQPYTPYQPATISQPNGVTLPTANKGQALYSFCDYYYNSGVLGADSCRPILANPHGAKGSVAINAGPGYGYLDMATGQPVSRTTDKWLINNQYEAEALGNPYPGVGRNTLRGNTVNELDMSVFKTVQINERFSAQFRVIAYNVPNRMYLGNPDPLVTDAIPTHTSGTNNHFASFENYLANGGTIVGSPFGKGDRNIQLGAKLIF